MPPLVSCLCPTYGRFTLLRQSLACFLAQQYEPKEFIILNDHPQPISCDYPGVRVVNAETRFPNMGQKRQALLELARGEWACQWDDDDFYLPWHVSHWLPILMASGKKLLKVDKAFSSRGADRQYMVIGLTGNAYQSQYIFEMNAAREIGYGDWWIVEAREFGRGFLQRGLVLQIPEDGWASMIYGWANKTCHASAYGESKNTYELYARRNQDGGEVLEPADIRPQLRVYRDYVRANLDEETYRGALAIVDEVLQCPEQESSKADITL